MFLPKEQTQACTAEDYRSKDQECRKCYKYCMSSVHAIWQRSLRGIRKGRDSNRARSGCVNVREQKILQLVNCAMTREGIFESHLEFV